ncbi:RICIN domain-containing protein [Streptomyces sp. WG7]|uniref:RICIN domain-containing protein n=1 Tax=Streptomyces sp. WG7 TaxID=3417650 RepID=UPI003CFA95FE
MPELPKRNTGQGRPVSSPPDRHAGINDAAKVAAARAALARAAMAHRAGAGDDEGHPPPEPAARNADRDASATAPVAPGDNLRPGPRRPRAKWIAIAAAMAVAVIAAAVAVTTSGTQEEAGPQVHAAEELPRPEVTEPVIPGAERSGSASASATASSRPPSTASPTPSGQETRPSSDKAAADAEPEVSKAPLKEGADRGGDPARSPGRALAVESSGNCLTGAGSGSGLVVAACTGATSQSWNTGSGTALQQGGLCATTTGTADRTPVVLAPCDRSAAQQFSLSGKALLSTSSGKCLDLFGGASGTQVVLWECNGRDNQRWSSA